jgi:acetyl-CoA synthase
VDKVQVTIYTEPQQLQAWLARARTAYDYRNKRLADLTDNSVNEFYSCILCQSFAPDHVCIVSPERLGLCGAYNWLDCKASFSINPTGPNQPIKLGTQMDGRKGYWTGINQYARAPRTARSAKSPCTRSWKTDDGLSDGRCHARD